MKLTQVKGNTWVAEGMELIPFYKLPDGRCILLDTGLRQEGDELEEALTAAGLTPAAILNSHSHVDHCGNDRRFQEKYGTLIALTAPEAAMCCNLLTLKCYFLLLSPETVRQESSHMVLTPDRIIPPEDGPFSLLGAEFQIIHTPGHSAGHICVVTPDGVCYAADALLSHELLNAKLPYHLSHAMAAQSREKLRQVDCDAVILAHRGVCAREELPELIDENQALIRRRAQEILELVDRPMIAGQITAAICRRDQLLTKKPQRALRFERNVRFFLEYLVDQGELELVCQRGAAFYRRPQRD